MSKDAPSAGFLDKIQGPMVEMFGFALAGGGSLLFVKSHIWHMYGIYACLFVYLLSRDFPRLFAWIKFAKIEWVSFVSVAVAVLVAAHIGGWHAEIIIAGLATMCVGRLFNYLY